MKLRLALSALTVAAVAAGAPMIAAAQAPSGGNVVASTPVPNPPEKAHAASTHKVTHHRKTKVSHRRHKAASARTKAASAAPAKTAAPMKMASAKTTSHKATLHKTTTTKK